MGWLKLLLDRSYSSFFLRVNFLPTTSSTATAAWISIVLSVSRLVTRRASHRCISGTPKQTACSPRHSQGFAPTAGDGISIPHQLKITVGGTPTGLPLASCESGYWPVDQWLSGKKRKSGKSLTIVDLKLCHIFSFLFVPRLASSHLVPFVALAHHGCLPVAVGHSVMALSFFGGSNHAKYFDIR